MQKNSSFNKGKFFSWAWTAIVAGCLCVFLIQAKNGITVESDLLKLLPRQPKDSFIADATEHFMREVSHKVFILVGASDFENTKNAADTYADYLNTSGRFSSVSWKIKDTPSDLVKLYSPYKENLLSSTFVEQLSQADAPQILSERVLNGLSVPFSSLGQVNVAADPVFLLPEFFASFPKPPGKVGMQDGYRVVQSDRTFVILSGVLKENVFSRENSKRSAEVLDMADVFIKDKFPDVQVIHSGALEFSKVMAQSAENDIFLITFGSTVLLIGLLWMTFKSIVPILCSFLTVSVGLLFAITLSSYFFSSLHVLTLGFGATLIGVCADYSFHFFCHQYESNATSSKEIVQKIRPGLILGVASSIAGYLGMFLVPFPGLNQMAFFAVVGMMASALCVICWFHWLPVHPSPDRIPFLLRVSHTWLQFYQTALGAKLWKIAAVICLPFILYGIAQVTINDDVKSLQKLPADVVAREQQVKNLLGDLDSARFILVSGKTEEEVLQAQEKVIEKLKALKATAGLKDYYSLSSFVPSTATQKEKFDHFTQSFLTHEPSFRAVFEELGFKADLTDDFFAQLKHQKFKALTVDEFFRALPDNEMKSLWLGKRNGVFVGLIALSGVMQLEQIESVRNPSDGIFLVDLVKDPSHILAVHRVYTTWILIFCYILIYAFFVIRYGFISGTLGMMPGIIGIVVTVGILGLLGHPITLFSILANAIVLGLAVDYSIFLLEGGNANGPSMMAIILSAISTMLSFGLLAISGTAVLQSFGISLFTGIAVAMLLSPFVTRRIKHGV